MNMILKRIIICLFFVIVFFAFHQEVLAQEPPPEGPLPDEVQTLIDQGFTDFHEVGGEGSGVWQGTQPDPTCTNQIITIIETPDLGPQCSGACDDFNNFDEDTTVQEPPPQPQYSTPPDDYPTPDDYSTPPDEPINTPGPTPVISCNSSCSKDKDCKDAKDSCTKCINNKCQVEPTKTPTPTKIPDACNVTCIKDSDCTSTIYANTNQCTACVPNPDGTKTCKVPPACNVNCTSNFDCAGAKDGCTVCSPNNKCVPPATPTPTPKVPACNVTCSIPSDCAGAKDGCTLCGSNNKCVPPPTPTKIPSACNVSCVKDSDCQADIYSSSNLCTACVGGVCKVPPACNVTCASNFDCQGAKDGCTICGSNNKCQVPPTPTPTSTPTPIPFNPDSCKCDGIQYTDLVTGATATITSFAKVEGKDVSTARVESQTFRFFEGDDIVAKLVSQTNPIPATIDSQEPNKVRYKSVWSFTLPDLKPGLTYRIQSVINCKPRTVALSFTPANQQKRGILAAHTRTCSGVVDSILSFLNRITFGTPTCSPQGVAPTPTPAPSLDEVGVFQEVPSPTPIQSLQLKTIYPVEVFQKTCSFIKFRYQGFGG